MKNYISTLIKKATEGIWEKEHIFSLALLCSIAGESIFLLGPPGTAKSMIARRLKEVFKEKKAFEYLMSRFSTPDEIFGPVSISKLKNEDIYERSIEGYLPAATVVFLDEIWKAGPAIQNSLLTVINEKVYQNGKQTINLPMKALIAASNELPEEDEGLEALWDRFVVRIVSNCISNEKTFYKMLCQKQQVEINIPDELCISDEQYMNWQRMISDIEVPYNILETITIVRGKLKEATKAENRYLLDYYISDRRWKKILHLLQTSAFLNGRDSIDHSDLCLLYHTLWNKVECIPTILKIVSYSLFADFNKQLDKIENELDINIKNMLPTQAQKEFDNFKIYNYFYFKLTDYPKGNCYVFISDYKYITPTSDTDGIIYWDEGQKAYLIRNLDINHPFATSHFDTSKVKRIKIRKSIGGIEIDKCDYRLEPEPNNNHVLQNELLPFEENKTLAIELLYGKISSFKNNLNKRLESMNRSENLFISSDDVRLAKKEAASLKKQIDQIEIKTIGLFKPIIP